MPYERTVELRRIAAAQFIAPKTLDGYFEALDRLRRAAHGFDVALTNALGDALERERRPDRAAGDDVHDLEQVPGRTARSSTTTCSRPPRGPTASATTRSAHTSARAARRSGTTFVQRHAKGRFKRVRARFARRRG